MPIKILSARIILNINSKYIELFRATFFFFVFICVFLPPRNLESENFNWIIFFYSSQFLRRRTMWIKIRRIKRIRLIFASKFPWSESTYLNKMNFHQRKIKRFNEKPCTFETVQCLGQNPRLKLDFKNTDLA